MIAKSDSRGGEWSDYLEIYQTIRRNKPTEALELGSGVTSFVIAYALHKNKNENGVQGKLTSMENLEFFHEQIKSFFPHEFSSYVNFVLSERKEKMYGDDLLGCYYESIPDISFDFIFVDGPAERLSKTSKKAFNSDLINLVKDRKLTSFVGLIDQRISAYRAYKKLLPEITLRYMPLRKMTFFKAT